MSKLDSEEGVSFSFQVASACQDKADYWMKTLPQCTHWAPVLPSLGAWIPSSPRT